MSENNTSDYYNGRNGNDSQSEPRGDSSNKNDQERDSRKDDNRSRDDRYSDNSKVENSRKDDGKRDERRKDDSHDRRRDDSRDRRHRRDRDSSRERRRRSSSRDKYRRRSPSPRSSRRRSPSPPRSSRRRSPSPKREEKPKTIVPVKSNRFWDGFQWVDRTPMVAPIAASTVNADDQAAILAASVGQKDRRIYVGNLPQGVTTDMIKEFIHNALLACNFVIPGGLNHTVTSVWISSDARYAFVELCSAEAATIALALSGINFMGMTLKISRPKTYTGSGSERIIPGYMVGLNLKTYS